MIDIRFTAIVLGPVLVLDLFTGYCWTKKFFYERGSSGLGEMPLLFLGLPLLLKGGWVAFHGPYVATNIAFTGLALVLGHLTVTWWIPRWMAGRLKAWATRRPGCVRSF